MAELVKTPELRFPEFNNSLDSVKLGKIATFSKGKGVSKADIADEGILECIRYGELYTLYTEVIDEVYSKTNVPADELVLSEANDVIIPASGETQIDIATASCVLREGIALGGDLNIIKSPINGTYLSYYLNNARKTQIARLSQGISVVHIYASQLKTLSLKIPQPEEQQKIASFLTAVDEHIQLMQEKKAKLEEYKKGVMQKLFSQEIRFKDKNSNAFPDWEEKRLETIIDYEQPTKYLVSDTEYKEDYPIPVLTAGKTFLLGFTNETEGVFEEKLPTIIFDDFTTAFQFVDFPFKAKSSAMKMLIPKTENVNIRFVFEAMKTVKFPLAEHKRYWISEYQKERIPYPSISEQNKIVEFLTSIDDSIASIGKKVEGTTTFKQGLLQKMFV